MCVHACYVCMWHTHTFIFIRKLPEWGLVIATWILGDIGGQFCKKKKNLIHTHLCTHVHTKRDNISLKILYVWRYVYMCVCRCLFVYVENILNL